MNRKGPWEGYRQQAKSRPLSPSRLPSRAHFHRERETSGYEAATRLRVWFLPLSPLWNRVLKSPFVWGICYSILTLEQGRFSNPWLFPIKLRWNNTPVNRCMNRIPNILIILVKTGPQIHLILMHVITDMSRDISIVNINKQQQRITNS